MASLRKRELEAEVKRLRRELEQNEKLMRQVLLKVEAMEGARQSLQNTVKDTVKAGD